MNRMPDAPWIRQAERFGIPGPEPVKCPCCGEECETIYKDQYGNPFACDMCVIEQEAWEWNEAEKLASGPEWEE